MLRLLLRFVVGLGVFCVAASVSSTARADVTIRFATTSFPRLDKNGAPIQKRNVSQHPEGVSFRDCVDELRIAFPLVLSGFDAGGSLQAWVGSAGVDCSDATNRAGAAARCWPAVASIPIEPTIVVNVPVRALLAADASASACTGADVAPRTVQFLYFSAADPGNAAASATTGIEVDTALPAPPSDLALVSGDARLVASWDVDPDATAFYLFCDPCSSGLLASADGGALVPDAAFLAQHQCGAVAGASAASADVSPADGRPLVDGQPYAVALSSVDDFGNVGPLSAPVCETPRAQPPSAGETSACSFGVRRSRSASDLAAAALALGLVLAARRRR